MAGFKLPLELFLQIVKAAFQGHPSCEEIAFNVTLPAMEKVLFFALLFSVTFAVIRCAEVQEPVPNVEVPAPIPQRVILLLLPQFDPAWVNVYGLQNVRRLAAHGLSFSSLGAGLPGANPAASFPVIASGRQARRLPWQDEYLRTAHGVVSVTTLSPAKSAQLLRNAVGNESLAAKLAMKGSVTTIAPDKTIASWLSAGAKVSLRLAKTTYATGAAVRSAMAEKHWAGILAAFPPVDPAMTLEFDRELGTICDKLDEINGWTDTLVVLTAAAGMQPPTVRQFSTAGLIAASLADTTLRFWLSDRDPVRIRKFTRDLRGRNTLTEIYVKYDTERTHQYVRVSRGRAGTEAANGPKSQDWVNAVAAAGAPDVIAWRDGQPTEAITRIPLFIAVPDPAGHGTIIEKTITLADLMPMVLRLLRIAEPANLDGTARAIDPYLEMAKRGHLPRGAE